MLPGIARWAAAVSLAWLIEVPLTRSRFGTGAPVGPLRVRSGMTTKDPPAGRAGVLARMPATRTVSGPLAPSVRSWTGAEQGGGGRRGQHRYGGAVGDRRGRSCLPDQASREGGKRRVRDH